MSNREEWTVVPVSESDAEAWVNNWINPTDRNGVVQPTQMRAFAVHKEELIAVLQQLETEFVRMYIGRRVHEDDGQMHPCLLLVSAAYAQELSNPGTTDPVEIVDLIGSYPNGAFKDNPTPTTYLVYDFSKPCPPRCNPQSPLFVPSISGQNCD